MSPLPALLLLLALAPSVHAAQSIAAPESRTYVDAGNGVFQVLYPRVKQAGSSLQSFVQGGSSGSSSSQMVPSTSALSSPDDCASALVIAGNGTFPFDNTAATTGTQGQSEPACSGFSYIGIAHDVWFVWTANASGKATLSTCGLTTVDTKIAVYAGSGCPATPALACNEDACSLQSTLCWDVSAGSVYTIQLGTFPPAAGGVGQFRLQVAPGNSGCTWDDGGAENLLGWIQGGEMVWLNRFATPASTTQLDRVGVQWASLYGPGVGTAATLAVWTDGASQDGDPTDATLQLLIPVTVQASGLGGFQEIVFPMISLPGVFFVGAGILHSPGQYVAPMDMSCPSPNVAWFFGTPGGSANYAAPGANAQPPATFTSAGFASVALIRAGCAIPQSALKCEPGVGGTIACPCANPAGGPARGCDNSSATGGALITGSGRSSLTNPTASFTTTGENATSLSILLQGTMLLTTPPGTVFGQGVRCTGGSLKRLYARQASAGSVTLPVLWIEPPIPSRSAVLGDVITASTKRFYSVYYRDPIVLGGCSSASTFNISATWEVLWTP